jgi:thioredoxin-related protein
MKKLILFFLAALFIQNSFAAGIRFVENKKWKEILALAKKENKLVFLDGYATWCGPCKYMQQDIFTQTEVGNYFNAKFINVKLDMEEGEGLVLSEKFDLTAYPTLFFINGEGELVHKYVGALDAKEFITLGKNALDPQKQFFSRKDKAAKGKLAPEDFHNWLHDAEDLKEDADSVIASYLSYDNYPLLEKDMLDILLDHVRTLTGEQLHFLFDNREKIKQLTARSSDELDKTLLSKVRSFAISESLSNEEIDFALFQKTVAQFFPKKAAAETQKMKVKYYFIKEEVTEAIAALEPCLGNTPLKISVEELATIIIDYADIIIEKDQAGTVIKKIGQYQVSAADADLAYYKDLALLIIYYKQGDKKTMETVSARILQNNKTPEEIRELVTGLRDK